ncbi:MAG TPA: SPASM domain-containing protein [Candidatus Deferrimicrobium sp.]|nr:SPASM domain-containing protein [Candidatus Deferrimicrobium sp.]
MTQLLLKKSSIAYDDFEWLQKVNPFVGFSLHGPKEIHDAFCQMEGSYDKTLASLKTSIKMNINAGVITCVTKLNYNYYYTWIQSLVGLGISTFFILYFSPLGRGNGRHDLQLSNEEWMSLYLSLKDYVLYSNLPLNIYFETSVFQSPPPLSRGARTSCYIFYNSNCVVDANGDVYPCILLLRNPEFRLGNFKINSMYEIWSRSNPELWDTKLQSTSKCDVCSSLPICRKGCPAYYSAGLDFRCDGKHIPICPLYTELL